MNLNATLLGQMIAFGLFVWFCWKFVWPPLLAAMEERAEKIVEESKNKATEEKDRIVGSAQSEIEKEVVNAKKTLEKDFAASVMSAVKKIVAKEVSMSNYQDTVDKSLDDFRK